METLGATAQGRATIQSAMRLCSITSTADVRRAINFFGDALLNSAE